MVADAMGKEPRLSIRHRFCVRRHVIVVQTIGEISADKPYGENLRPFGEIARNHEVLEKLVTALINRMHVCNEHGRTLCKRHAEIFVEGNCRRIIDLQSDAL